MTDDKLPRSRLSRLNVLVRKRSRGRSMPDKMRGCQLEIGRSVSQQFVIGHLSSVMAAKQLMPEFTLTSSSTHNRWNRDLSPQLTVGSDPLIHIECLDSSGGQVGPDSTLADFLAIDRDKIHTLTGPVLVEDAQPGDVLRVEFLKIAHRGWGWTSIIPGLGFLPEHFPEPFFFSW